jgi:hypothetical protein
MNTDWKTQFRDLFYRGTERYQEGRRSPETMFEGDEPTFLESIGCSTQEMFDFCDDYIRWGDVIYEHVEEVQAVRLDYFANDLNSQPSACRMEMEEFPAKTDEIAGIVWLPRLIVKARAKLEGALPADLMYG